MISGVESCLTILNRGKFYRVACYRKNRLLTPPELQLQIQGIIDDAETACDPGEDLIATMTASKRTDWYVSQNSNKTKETYRVSHMHVGWVGRLTSMSVWADVNLAEERRGWELGQKDGAPQIIVNLTQVHEQMRQPV